ncbi:Csu type fimbrial protein [Halomonas caseinilytica]|uniref:Csu type fimbrial protein n=1 Tax=Halomonas caseinilytica TaxID=438744 RepID=UPI000848C5B1|nr:spore coat U domain-containing protein [Halomonas caseinilytica]
MKMKKMLLACTAGISMGVVGLANAQQATGQIEVTATVMEGCAVSTDGAQGGGGTTWGTLDFGTLQPIWSEAVNADVVGTASGGVISVVCSGGVNSFTLALDGGTSAGAERQITTAEGEALAYNVYQDEARTEAYGIDTAVTFNVTDGQPVEVPLYGQLLANATAAVAGTYTDTLTATLQF